MSIMSLDTAFASRSVVEPYCVWMPYFSLRKLTLHVCKLYLMRYVHAAMSCSQSDSLPHMGAL